MGFTKKIVGVLPVGCGAIVNIYTSQLEKCIAGVLNSKHASDAV